VDRVPVRRARGSGAEVPLARAAHAPGACDRARLRGPAEAGRLRARLKRAGRQLARPLTWGTLSRRLERWTSDCDIRDATGQPARVTMHQFRHTLGTRMINNDVPLPAIQRMLDHDSPEMTLRYARIKDQTLRREWEAYQQRINIQGEVIHLDPGGPLSDAAWALENLARAKQTLPNGYCGLPLQQTCPHPNACLTCDNFLTTVEFLPAHREQLQRTEQLIASAQESGAQRLVEINEPVRIADVTVARLRPLGLDGLILYESTRKPSGMRPSVRFRSCRR
jgi:hypothetical protein